VQKGEATTDAPKPPRASLPKTWPPEDLTLARALDLLNLPRLVGQHPEDAAPIEAAIGRFGPYIQVDKLFVSIKPLDPLKISLDEAQKLYQEKQEMQRRIKRLEEQLGAKAESIEGSDSLKDLEDALQVTKDTIAREEQEASSSKARLTASQAAEIFSKNASPFRSKSAPHGAARSPQVQQKSRVSSAEDADIDRYNQKQLILRQREKEAALEQERYEQQLRERMLRASRGSVEGFDELLKRQKEAQDKSHAKFLEKKAALDRAEAEKAAVKAKKEAEKAAADAEKAAAKAARDAEKAAADAEKAVKKAAAPKKVSVKKAAAKPRAKKEKKEEI
jgi:hypothetical protein